MGYQHIDNLYKNQDILLFREAYAMEKIHGTSAHVAWHDGAVRLFSGGEKLALFTALFDMTVLASGFAALGHKSVIVFGEAYGGKQQGQSRRYGSMLRFVAFEVKIDNTWLAVPAAESVVKSLGLEFVHYRKVSTDLTMLDAERDAPSEQARRNGVADDQPREGIVLRPLIEVQKNNGERIIAKHKRDEERETKTPRGVVDPGLRVILAEADAIADEWVTPTRLEHVLDKLGTDMSIERTRDVIQAMIADVEREATGEIVASREARVAISKVTAKLFKARLRAQIAKT